MMRRRHRSGFTLVELLVVIGIIAILVGVLLPALARARQSSYAVKCAANLRSIGQGLLMYVSEQKGTFPAAYIYEGHKIEGNQQSPDSARDGYVHWSCYLYKKGRGPRDNTIFKHSTGWEPFQCPMIENGGLPPTNTVKENRDAGQNNDDGDNVIDQQAPRCAYTVNEAIMPRNKFVKGFQGALRVYQFVRASQIKKSAETILATEWNQDWRIVAESGRSSPDETVCKSHRPVHGFVATNLNMEMVGPDVFRNPPPPVGRRALVSDLSPDPRAGGAFNTRLDWVGRNHGTKKLEAGFDTRKTNFLYVDGHVESKGIRETLQPRFEWGERFYSLSPNADIAPGGK